MAKMGAKIIQSSKGILVDEDFSCAFASDFVGFEITVRPTA